MFVAVSENMGRLVKVESYTEEELVRQLRLHDEEAFRFLYDHYSRALFTIISRIIPQQANAEDVLQQVFLKIWNNIRTFDESKGRLFTWMLNIARNQSIDFTRSKDFNNQAQTGTLGEDVYKDKLASTSIRDVGLQKILENLPAESRRLLELSYFLGYTQDEISRILNIPLGTVKTRLRTIIIQLRKTLDIKNN